MRKRQAPKPHPITFGMKSPTCPLYRAKGVNGIVCCGCEIFRFTNLNDW